MIVIWYVMDKSVPPRLVELLCDANAHFSFFWSKKKLPSIQKFDSGILYVLLKLYINSWIFSKMFVSLPFGHVTTCYMFATCYSVVNFHAQCLGDHVRNAVFRSSTWKITWCVATAEWLIYLVPSTIPTPAKSVGIGA